MPRYIPSGFTLWPLPFHRLRQAVLISLILLALFILGWQPSFAATPQPVQSSPDPAVASEPASAPATPAQAAAPLMPSAAASAQPAAAASPQDMSSSAQAEPGQAAKAGEDDETPAQARDEAWDVVWSGQKEMLNDVRETALKLSEDFSRQAQDLSLQLQPFEDDGRRLLVFANTFQGYPNAMEAVSRRISATIAGLDHVLDPLEISRREAEGLLERINQMALNLPDASEQARLSDELKDYVNLITRVRFRLTAVLAQYDSLLPSMELIKQLESKRQAIQAELPELWKNWYLQKPLAWLNPVIWQQQGTMLYYTWQVMLLRLPVEIPTTAPEWGNAILRFFITLFFSGALWLIARKRLLHRASSVAARHMFDFSLPCLVLGCALLGSGISATGEFFRLLLILASLCFIVGEIFLAWDLRRMRHVEELPHKPPFLRLAVLAVGAYFLLYMPVTQPLCLVLWACLLVLALWHLRREKPPTTGRLQFEKGVLDCYAIVLWSCLFLTVVGLYLYSMGLYLAYVSVAIAVELSLGGMSIVNYVNTHVPAEGVRALLAHLLVALAAPFVILLGLAGVCVWAGMLPGGSYILQSYALRGVSIGATQFNAVQVLLILSVFYLTRAVVAMGTRFVAKLPQQNKHFDGTLVTPLSTGLTYTAWALFGLFVLRALGMELSSLAMVAGGLSVGIGFGLQTIVNNFVSGLILIFSRALQVGDVVEVGGAVGRVRKISVRATMVETYDNAVIYVPNSEFISSRLTNWTSFTRSVRREIQVGVAYGSDTQQVVDLLIEAAKSNGNVMQFPAPSVVFADFGASSLDFKLRFWVRDYELGASTSSAIRLTINRIFAEKGIEISFPQLDVHLKDMPREARAVNKPAASSGSATSGRPGPRLVPRRPVLRKRPASQASAVSPQQSQAPDNRPR